ncbi:MAG: acylneuraminate cytidylyltransferase family protein [Patescibacteria group bacterium]
MYKNKIILGVITARGGSKSIPKKNIINLAGKPLITYTIEATKKSRYLTRTIVSTDDQEIADIAKKYGAEVPFLRPAHLAQDQSTSMEVVQYCLKWFKENEDKNYDYLMILQPTSPLRTAKDIDNCIIKAIDTGADSVMSMKEMEDFSIKKLKRIENDLILPWLKEEGKESSRRQDLDKVYKRNCAIYLTKTELIIQGDLFGSISRPYLMPDERSVDINSLVDLDIAEFWLKKEKNI